MGFRILYRWLLEPLAAGLFMLLFNWKRLLGYVSASGLAWYAASLSPASGWDVWIGIGSLLILAWEFGFRTMRPMRYRYIKGAAR